LRRATGSMTPDIGLPVASAQGASARLPRRRGLFGRPMSDPPWTCHRTRQSGAGKTVTPDPPTPHRRHMDAFTQGSLPSTGFPPPGA
jgi:hypothetical protein